MSSNLLQQMLIEQRVSNDTKSAGIAYLLLIFLGFFGIHRFYLGYKNSGIAMLTLTLGAILTAPIGVGAVLFVGILIWSFVDLFLIPNMTNQENSKLRQKLTCEMLLNNENPAPVNDA